MGHDDVVRRLADACATKDFAAVLDADVVAVCDTGGRVPGAEYPLQGADDVARLVVALGGETDVVAVNGSAGLALRRDDRVVGVVAVSAAGERVTALWIVLNPDKLRGWQDRPK